MAFVQNFQQQFQNIWNSVDAGTRVMTVLVAVVLVVSFGVAISLNRRPAMALLFSNLADASAAAVVSNLDDNNIVYELRNGGRDIYIHKGRVHQARLMLKGRGLPKEAETVGFEIFDKSQFGVTEFVQNIQHRRALEGELERTISKIRGVEGVRVHVVIPEAALFREDKKETTTTVFLKLVQEGILEAGQVKGIQQLTSAAVEGLNSKNVTVVDNFGNTLAAPVEDDLLTGMLSTRVGVQKSVESHYERKIQSMLDGVLGSGRSIVRVDALLDFDKIEETEERYNPESAVVRKETITSETSSGSSASARGAPGVQSNLQPGAAVGAGTEQEKQTSREVINNAYEIDRTVRHIIRGVGDIRMLTASVFIAADPVLDESRNPVRTETGEVQHRERSTQQITTFTDIVKNAMGYNESRGDQILLTEIPFTRQPFGEVDFSALKAPMDLNPLIANLSKVFAFLLFLGILMWLWKQVSLESSELPGGSMTGGGGSESGLESLERGGAIDNRVAKVVNQFPDESEQVIRGWLKE